MIDLTTFKRIVRPTRVAGLSEAWAMGWATGPTDEPVLLHGSGQEAVAIFAAVGPQVGYGSAVVIEGVPTADANVVDRLEEVARACEFRTWFRGADMPGFPPDARSWVKSVWTGSTYSSHLPILLEAVRRTTGPVLELGSGDGSTPKLHEVCAQQGRLLVTVDNNEEWLGRYRHLESPLHKFERLADPASTDCLSAGQWGVVFVDHAPGETRGRAIERARHRAEIIVVHDTETLDYNLWPVLETFTHCFNTRRERPWTTAVSMQRSLESMFAA